MASERRMSATLTPAMSEVRPAARYRFGVFEADTTTGELRRQGLRVKLHAQPLQLLFLLLQRPGELLTREEISRELWPEGTFVDYEHGVNSAVNRIREALGDKASSPRFIETLARRGYRFVAPVERIVAEGDGLDGAAAPELAGSGAIAAEVEANFFDRVLSGPEDLPKSPHHVVKTLFLLLQAMYLAFYVGALANLAEIRELLAPLPHSSQILTVLIVTAAVLIPVRAFLLCAVLFRAPALRGKFLKLWPFLLVLDVLWALSPFLLLHHINYGLALACMALLVYSPFAQRSLILMGAGDGDRKSVG
jgi:DNA-binding winged helix-turn-helix (wHTH) protein